MASAILWIWLFSKDTTMKIILVKYLKELESPCSTFEYGQLHTGQSCVLVLSEFLQEGWRQQWIKGIYCKDCSSVLYFSINSPYTFIQYNYVSVIFAALILQSARDTAADCTTNCQNRFRRNATDDFTATWVYSKATLTALLMAVV